MILKNHTPEILKQYQSGVVAQIYLSLQFALTR